MTIQTEPQSVSPTPPPVPTPSGAALVDEVARPLSRLLGRVRRRAARIERTRTLLLSIAWSFVALFVAAALTALKQEWARPVGWTLAAATVLVGMLVALVRGRRALGDDVAAARALAKVAPKEASDFVSAVELARALESDSPPSPALVRAHVERMGVAATSVDERPAVSKRPVTIAVVAVAGALVAHAIFFLVGGEHVRGAYRFLAFRAEAESQALFAPEPIAGDISLTYRYPAHMHRADRTVAGTGGDIRAPKGTVVQLTAEADRDVTQAFAVYGSHVVPLAVKGRALAGSFIVTDPGDWHLRYAKANGRVVAEGPKSPVAIEPDAVPQVSLTAPKAELEVQGKEPITVGYTASDDYGLTKLELVYSLGHGAPEVRKQIASFTDTSRRQRGEMNWDLSALDLKPGDRVTYRIEATDNDTVSGPKTGASLSQVLKVFSETEHHREMLKKAEEQWEALVRGLGHRLEEPAPGARGENASAEWEKTTGQNDEALTAVATGMRAVARELLADRRAPKALGPALEHVGKRLGGLVQHTTVLRHALATEPSGPTSRGFTSSLETEVREEENDVLYLEDLIDREKFLELSELTRELQQGREELTRLIEQYKKAPDEATKREIMSEVARLKERLTDIFKRMRELQRGIVDEHLNQEADRMMAGGQDMMSQLDQIQQQLAQGKTDDALKELEQFEKQLDKMQKDMEQQAGDVDEAQKQLAEKLQKLASNLRDVEGDENALKHQTDQLRSREKEAQKAAVDKLGKEFIDKEKARVDEAEKELQGVDDQLAERLNTSEDLQFAKDRLEQVKQALDAGDFDGALEQATAALQKDESMRELFGSERDATREFPGLDSSLGDLEPSTEHVERAHDPMQKLTKDLQKLLDGARTPPTPEERQKMRELSKQQQAVQQRAQALQQQMDDIGKQAPIFGPQQGQLLKQAAGQMQDAQGQLGQGDSRRASGKEGDALQKLQSLEQAMRSQKNGQGQGGVPMPFAAEEQPGEGDQDGQDGESARNEKVEIPGADQSRAPAEFREELMKAMRDETPEHYKERVRQYYEELVK